MAFFENFRPWPWNFFTVLDGFFPYLAQLITSMRWCVAYNDLWPWPIYFRSFGLGLENRVRSLASTVLWRMTMKNNRTPLLCCFKLCASFHSHQWIKTGVTVRKRPIGIKIDDFFSRVTLKFDGWTWKTIVHPFFATSSFVHHFVANNEFKLELQSGNAQFGSKTTILLPCDLEIWRMTLKHNRAPLLSNIKLCASFHHHMWIQTGVTVRKRLSWVLTSVTLTFDIWPWPFAWTSLVALVITPKFHDDMMMGT